MNLLCIILLSLSIVNSLTLIFKQGNYRIKNKMLGISLLCYHISLLVYFIWFETGYIIDQPHLLRTISPLMYLNGPFFYFYIRNSLLNTDGLKTRDYLHFIPAIIHLIDLIPFYLLPFNEKQEIAKMIFSDKVLLNYLGSGFIPISFHYLFRMVLQLIYLVYCIYLVQKSKPQFMTLINREKLKNWLFISLFLMGVVIFSNFCHTLTTYFGQNQDQYTGLKLFFSCIAFLGILSLNFYMNFNPELVYNGFKGSLIKEELAINNAIKKPDFLKELVEVEIKDADLLLEKIRSALEDKKFFLGKGLTIVDLAKNIDVSPKILSILINRKFKTNFNELINIYRVNYAKQLLEENVLALYSIEGLASMVGFNSRITFFNSFKKNVGISPKEYAKSLLTAKELAS